jgi:hypothetical protein
MKIAIVGSREYRDLGHVVRYVKSLPKDTVVISGGARGVDNVAANTARDCGLEVVIFPALWHIYGNQAGVIRNGEIVDLADKVVAFHDGVSKGTLDTIKKAKLAKKPLEIYDTNGVLSVPTPNAPKQTRMF